VPVLNTGEGGWTTGFFPTSFCPAYTEATVTVEKAAESLTATLKGLRWFGGVEVVGGCLFLTVTGSGEVTFLREFRELWWEGFPVVVERVTNLQERVQ